MGDQAALQEFFKLKDALAPGDTLDVIVNRDGLVSLDNENRKGFASLDAWHEVMMWEMKNDGFLVTPMDWRHGWIISRPTTSSSDNIVNVRSDIFTSFPNANELRHQVEADEAKKRPHSYAVTKDHLVGLNRFKSLLRDMGRHDTIQVSTAMTSGNEMLVVLFTTGMSSSGGAVFATMDHWRKLIMPALEKEGFIITDSRVGYWTISLYK